jgi:hypothetical protein
MKIEKKIWPDFFQLVSDGVKNTELRLADFECQPGDILLLREWDPKTQDYTGREIEREVSHVVKTKGAKFYTQEEIEKYGFLVIGLK